MNPNALLLILLVSFGALGYLLNHIFARVAYLELALSNEAPRRSTLALDAGSGVVSRVFSVDAAAESLPADGTVLFASTGCVTCTRLLDELAADDVHLDHPVTVYFSGDKPPVPVPGAWFERAQDRFDRLGVPATPYAAVMVDGQVRAHGPVPDPRRLQGLLVAAGVDDRLPLRLLGSGDREPGR